LAASNARSEPSSLAPQAGVIRFGLTPVFLSNDLEVLDELQAYLSGAVGQKVQLVTQRTYQEVTALLISGNLEAAWICGYPFMKYRTELELVATPLWRGRPIYQSYLIIDHNGDADENLEHQGGSSCIPTQTDFERLSSISGLASGLTRPFASWDIPPGMR